MATTNTESLTELERRAESTRAELAQTVDALHNRVSPSALKADLRSYVKENPLQAAAIAVGVAYPLWRMVAGMPAPVLLIGAGLAMTQRKSNAADRVYAASGEYGTAQAGSRSSQAGMMSDLKERATEFGRNIAGKAQATIDTVRDMTAEKVGRASDALSETFESSREATADTAQQVAGQVSDTYFRTRDSMADMIERNPLLVGGVAFALGSIVASAVPVTRQEQRLMGDTSEEMKRRAGGLAKRGLQEARTAAEEVYRSAAGEVRSEGLTPDVARRTAREAMERARGAVEETVSGTSPSGGRTGLTS